MVTSLKRVMVKHWGGMAEADVSSVVKTIKDLSCLHLHQYLVTGGIEVTEQPHQTASSCPMVVAMMQVHE